ncbi:MAG TPA: CHASE2 domain-containing protein [Cyclobacteriaceae bacterium]|nr:CHASE2 domain-containing protein [Cyclobacteriaceae bacterium]
MNVIIDRNKKILVFITLVLVSLIAFSCKSEYAKYVSLEPGIDNNIVFFNIKNYSRKELGDYIRKIDSLEPRVIALDVQFDELKDAYGDSVLASAIANSGKIVMSSFIDQNSIVHKSDPYFTQNILGDGVLSGVIDDQNVMSKYVPIFENNDGQFVAFPTLITLYYKFGLKNVYNYMVNNQYEIKFTKNKDQFVILDENSMQKKQVRGKIVFFGYLGPNHENEYLTPLDIVEGDDSKTYSAIITANIVLNLLKDKNLREPQIK